MGLALWREGENREADARDARRADVQICVAFDVLKANYLATLLTVERDFPPAGKEQAFSDSVRLLAEQVQIVDCAKIVTGFEDLRIVVTIPPPPTVTSLP